MNIEESKTERGFSLIKFEDTYGSPCSIQKSSLATADAIWLGIDDPKPQILAKEAAVHGIHTDKTTGWIPYPLSSSLMLTTRMHLTREQVAKLISVLQNFVDTGEVSK